MTYILTNNGLKGIILHFIGFEIFKKDLLVA